MGVSAAVGLGAAAFAGFNQADEARRARHTAQDAGEANQKALEELQAKPLPVVPVADDKAMRDARRRSIAEQMRRRGRQSTILTDTGAGDTLGGS